MARMTDIGVISVCIGGVSGSGRLDCVVSRTLRDRQVPLGPELLASELVLEASSVETLQLSGSWIGFM
jgi:hypothetical protein